MRKAEHLINQIRTELGYRIHDDDEIIICRPTDANTKNWPDGRSCQWGQYDIHICVGGYGEFYVESALTLEDVREYF